MAFSYSALNNYGKATLPSAEAWNTNMNILKDPPKSIHTRRIDKVGENSQITQQIEDSGDRVAESIQEFARGVNPSVSVSYSNNGMSSNGSLTSGGQTSAYLPYRIMRDGEFRPPVLPQEYLTPLSRQPRVWTSSYANPGFADYSRKARSCGTDDDYREVKSNFRKLSVRPTAVFNVETPLQPTYDVYNNIQNKILHSASSGLRTIDTTQLNVQIPTKETDINPLHAFANSNLSDIKHVNNSQVNTDIYLQDTNAHSVNSNISSDKHVNNSQLDTSIYLQDTNVHSATTNSSSSVGKTTSIDELFGGHVPLQHTMHTDYITSISGTERNNLDHQELSLKNNLPATSAIANKSSDQFRQIRHENEYDFDRNTPLTNCSVNISKQGDHVINSSRSVQLMERTDRGGFFGGEQKPLLDMNQTQGNYLNSHIIKNQQQTQNLGDRFS